MRLNENRFGDFGIAHVLGSPRYAAVSGLHVVSLFEVIAPEEQSTCQSCNHQEGCKSSHVGLRGSERLAPAAAGLTREHETWGQTAVGCAQRFGDPVICSCCPLLASFFIKQMLGVPLLNRNVFFGDDLYEATDRTVV